MAGFVWARSEVAQELRHVRFDTLHDPASKKDRRAVLLHWAATPGRPHSYIPLSYTILLPVSLLLSRPLAYTPLRGRTWACSVA